MRKFAFLAILTVFIFLNAIPLHADDTVLFTANVAPDALIMLDLSGSMGQNPGGEYNYQASYVANEDDPCTDTETWGTSGSGHTHKCAAVEGQIWGDSACNGPFYTWSGGSHKTDCSKLAIAKRALFNLLDANGGGKLSKADEELLNVRFGYMRFIECTVEDSTINYNNGCNTLRRGFDFDYDKLYDKYIKDEDNMYWTALASQLKEGKKYLDDHKAGDTAAECRKKFLILVTDGWDTVACGHDRDIGDEYVTGSFAYMRRRATVAAVKGAIDAGYTVFAVGFGADMPLTERNTLNWVARFGGTDNLEQENSGDPNAITDLIFSSNPCEKYDGCSPHQHDCTNAPNDPGYANLSGYAFLAQDATTLGRSLQTIIKWVKEKAFCFTAPTVPSVRLTDTENVYISSFAPNTTPFWGGDLKAYALNTDGTLPVDGNGFPSQIPVWEASPLLGNANPNGRKIYSYRQGSQKEFTNGNFSKEDLGVGTDDERNALINHVRGYDPYDIDGDTNTSESRVFKLGDIFHSQAVIVGAPSIFFVDDGYSGTGGFYNTKKNRTKVIIAGANDGMLHAFDAATGAEKWAFIPPSLLTNLKTLKTNWDTYKAGSAFEHLYYVDGSPRVSDVWFYDSPTDESKTVDKWRTVLINGLRKGGKTYFALNITDTNNPVYLWEFPKSTDAATLALVGESWSDPTIGRVKYEVGDELYERWVAFIGGGCDPAERKKDREDGVSGTAFFVVDIKSGEILWQFVMVPIDDKRKNWVHSVASSPTAVDTNGDGYVDKVYVGDLGGQMWVFNVSFNPITKKSNSQWSGQKLFAAPKPSGEKHTIYYPPSVAFDNSGNPWVLFGTGDRENPIEGGIERFYAVKDDGLGDYPREEKDLKYVGDSNDPVTNSKNTFTPPTDPDKGWYLKLAYKKEQVLGKPVVFNNIVYFTTYSPKEEDSDVCTVGGTARLYVMHYLSGGGALEVDALTDFDGSAGTRSKIIGSGLPSAPAITINAQGQATIIVGTTESQIYSQGAFSPLTNKQMLYWREVLY
jgi:type IV pilus assembly protein PilY1